MASTSDKIIHIENDRLGWFLSFVWRPFKSQDWPPFLPCPAFDMQILAANPLRSLLLLYGAYFTAAAPRAPNLDIRTTAGIFRGVSSPNVTEKWLGIPFAQQPVGKLRFRAPQPITSPPAGIQDASTFGNACPQPLIPILNAPIGEDCLHLNVCIVFLALLMLGLINLCRSGDHKASNQMPNCLFFFGYMSAPLLEYVNSAASHWLSRPNREAPGRHSKIYTQHRV